LKHVINDYRRLQGRFFNICYASMSLGFMSVGDTLIESLRFEHKNVWDLTTRMWLPTNGCTNGCGRCFLMWEILTKIQTHIDVTMCTWVSKIHLFRKLYQRFKHMICGYV